MTLLIILIYFAVFPFLIMGVAIGTYRLLDFIKFQQMKSKQKWWEDRD